LRLYIQGIIEVIYRGYYRGNIEVRGYYRGNIEIIYRGYYRGNIEVIYRGYRGHVMCVTWDNICDVEVNVMFNIEIM